MNIKTLAAASSFALLAALGTASAATFTIEPGSASVNGLDICWPGDCELVGGVNTTSFDLDTAGQSETISDLFTWSIDSTSNWATGLGGYDVEVTLNFSSPTSASANNSGYAGFVVAAGHLSAGGLLWNNGGTGSVDFGDGHVLSYQLDNVLAFGLGTSTTSGGTFTLVQAPEVAPVPLPASALLLMGGVGALGGLRARRKAKAA